MSQQRPSIDQWLIEARADPYGRRTAVCTSRTWAWFASRPKQLVRQGVDDGTRVVGMETGYDQDKVQAAVETCRAMEGIRYVRVWLNPGELVVGDPIMQVLIGGDIRPGHRRAPVARGHHQERVRERDRAPRGVRRRACA